jgi:L-amino acid N-acyltransferase YncA
MEPSMPDGTPEIRDAVDSGNAASVALHKWASFQQSGVPREVRRTYDPSLDPLFTPMQLSWLDPA